MGKLNYSIEFRNGTNVGAPPREQIIFFKVYSNNVGAPLARIYEEGTSAPAFIPMTAMLGGGYQLLDVSTALLGGKTYQLDYKDNGVQCKLFEIDVRNNNPGPYKGNIDYNSHQEILQVSASNGGLSIYYNVTDNAGNPNTVSIDSGATYRGNFYDDRYGGNRYYASWSEAELRAIGQDSIVPSMIFKTFGDSPESVEIIRDWFYAVPAFPEFLASASSTNVTASGASDGTITVFVSGGSGSYSFLWADGPTTQNRVGLPPDIYGITITDTVTHGTIFIGAIEITEPQVTPPVFGNILTEVPTNPVPFVPYTLDPGTPQTLDNTLFCRQFHKGYRSGQYFIPYEKTDPLVFQFNGNFANYTLQMFNHTTDELVNTYNVVLKQENVGIATDYAVRIQNDSTPGRSRI